MSLSCFQFLLTLLVISALTSGCGQNDVKVYNVPKEQPTQPSPATMPPGHPDLAASSASPQFKWKTPDGWKEVPPGEVRVASFQITDKEAKQADVSVIPLPGRAGGDLSNVNRWREQVGQARVSEEELTKLAQPVEVAGQPAALYEQNGETTEGTPARILAVIQHRDGTAWFFKMTGDDQLVAQQKPVFIEFLKSASFVTGETPAGLPASRPPITDATLPPGHPDISAVAAGSGLVAPSSTGHPQWTLPPGWKEVPGGQFLIAKFTISGEGNAQAAVNVSSSPGDGGGLAANVNRWRKQLGLSELSGDEIAKSVTKSGEVAFIALNGERAGLVAAIVTRPGETWFYKLMGDARIVAAQKDAFTKFVQEVKY